MNARYTGRFAPSPTGPLHFGSLLAALASFLDARSQQGRWLLRLENIDPPREVPEAQHQIPATLDHFGLEWDDTVCYQSQQQMAYQAALDALEQQNATYLCDCSRKALQTRSGGSIYDGFCRQRSQVGLPAAVRFATPAQLPGWQDRFQGYCQPQQIEDFILHRKDNLWSYHLAVTVDDAAQQISHVVRGFDLLWETPKQLLLQQTLGYPHPSYGHIPVLVNAQGQKLSKQNLAQPLDLKLRSRQIFQALSLLGQRPPTELAQAPHTELLDWGIRHWQSSRIPAVGQLLWEG